MSPWASSPRSFLAALIRDEECIKDQMFETDSPTEISATWKPLQMVGVGGNEALIPGEPLRCERKTVREGFSNACIVPASRQEGMGGGTPPTPA